LNGGSPRRVVGSTEETGGYSVGEFAVKPGFESHESIANQRTLASPDRGSEANSLHGVFRAAD
jgi:hypothetical protein